MRILESFNGNLHTELFDVQRFCDLAEMRRRLATHLHWYNHARTHHFLGGLLVPADRYYGRASEVLAAIEAGTGRDLGDGLELRDRCLEIFKVVIPQSVWASAPTTLSRRRRASWCHGCRATSRPCASVALRTSRST